MSWEPFIFTTLLAIIGYFITVFLIQKKHLLFVSVLFVMITIILLLATCVLLMVQVPNPWLITLPIYLMITGFTIHRIGYLGTR